jgi:hypothetical protein
MQKKSLVSLSAALILVTATFQYAQAQSTPAPAPTAAKKELISRLITLQRPGIEAMSRDMAQEPALQMIERAAAVVQARVPQDKQEAAIKGIQVDAKKYMDTTVPLVRDRAFALAPDAVGPVLAQRLTEDELKKVIAILESPEYAKFQQLSGEMQQALQAKLVAETRTSVEGKLKTLENDLTARLDAAVVAAPAPAASAPAKPAPNKAAKPATK